MLKINLNELRRYKVFVLYQDGYTFYDEEDEPIPDLYYFFGFIEDVYTKQGEIFFKVYGAGFNAIEDLKHAEFKVHMKDINLYEENKEYECMDIKESISRDYDDCRHYSSTKYTLFKNIDFEFIMSTFYNLVPQNFICDLEFAMLTDPYVLKIVSIPDDYEFAFYK